MNQNGLTQLRSELIDNGRMSLALDAAIITVANAVLQHYEQFENSATAKGKITLEIDLKKSEKYDDHCEIGYQIIEKKPRAPKRFSLAKQVGKTLMVDERTGSTQESVDQTSLGFMDRVNGE